MINPAWLNTALTIINEPYETDGHMAAAILDAMDAAYNYGYAAGHDAAVEECKDLVEDGFQQGLDALKEEDVREPRDNAHIEGESIYGLRWWQAEQ